MAQARRYLDPVTGDPQDLPPPPSGVPPPRNHTMGGDDSGGTNPDNTNIPAPNQPPLAPPPTTPVAPQPPPTSTWAPAPGHPPAATNSLDPATVVATWINGNNPQGHTDASYWIRRMAETGGLTADNLEYWKGRFLEAPGTHVEGGGGGAPSAPSGGGGNSLDPSISAFYNAQTANLARQQQRDEEIRAIIRSRLASAGGPVDETSAEVTQPLSAARDEVQRSQATERTTLAERLYAQGGLNTGALTQQVQQSAERNAGGLSHLRAGLIGHVADAKRAELMDLLHLATAQGDAESARTIQAQLGALNASVTSQGQGIQLSEFLAGLNQNAALAGLNG